MKTAEVTWLDFDRISHSRRSGFTACPRTTLGLGRVGTHEPFSASLIVCIWGRLLGPHPARCLEHPGPRGLGKPRLLGQERSSGSDGPCDGLWPQEGVP